MTCVSLILAAGLGTRMKSKIPKVLHLLGGVPIICWSVQSAREASGSDPVIVIGPEQHDVRATLDLGIRYVEQEERLGTGHAASQAAGLLQGKVDLVLVTSADMPLLRPGTLRRLIEVQERNQGPISLLTARVMKSRGFGRIKRAKDGAIQAIIEEAHANDEELALCEVNVGAYCFQADWLWDHLPGLSLSAKGEYYITDLIGMATSAEERVAWVEIEDDDEIIGINTREHLAEAHDAIRKRINQKWMLAGVTILDPTTTYIDSQAEIGVDTTILPNTNIEGRTIVGEDCVLGPNSVILESRIGDHCKVFMSVMTRAILENEVAIGPFAHLRPGAYLCQGVHMGNFGEVKNSTLGPGVKMGHFSYVGDAKIGKNSNISAGVITCNFDGKEKHPTEVGEDVFIGSDTMLVAPVRLGKGSRTGAGSVVRRDVPENTLVVGIPARAIRKLEESD